MRVVCIIFEQTRELHIRGRYPRIAAYAYAPSFFCFVPIGIDTGTVQLSIFRARRFRRRTISSKGGISRGIYHITTLAADCRCESIFNIME